MRLCLPGGVGRLVSSGRISRSDVGAARVGARAHGASQARVGSPSRWRAWGSRNEPTYTPYPQFHIDHPVFPLTSRLPSCILVLEERCLLGQCGRQWVHRWLFSFPGGEAPWPADTDPLQRTNTRCRASTWHGLRTRAPVRGWQLACRAGCISRSSHVPCRRAPRSIAPKLWPIFSRPVPAVLGSPRQLAAIPEVGHRLRIWSVS